uniref:Uncharacterized protein n=1 Tax=viral metagenome TaxID=1070528 RepID=A0A6M3IE82_9ZZZZ
MAANDVILIGVLIFMFAIGFFVLYNITATVTTRMIGISAINESKAAVEVLQATQSMTHRLDYVIFALFIGLVLALIITGWFIAGNPIFMVLYFFVVVMGIIFSAVLSNVWETMSSASIFGTTITAFAITNNLMSNLPIYLAIVGFIGIIVMFAKPYFGQNNEVY